MHRSPQYRHKDVELKSCIKKNIFKAGKRSQLYENNNSKNNKKPNKQHKGKQKDSYKILAELF